MESNNWAKAMSEVKSSLFQVRTPQGTGTGFLVASLLHLNLFVVVTAKHVIDQANKNDEPIELTHFDDCENVVLKKSTKGQNIFDLQKNERLIITPSSEFNDLALIFFRKDDLSLYLEPLELLDEEITLDWGTEVGWCGFPGLLKEALTIPFFFAGHISIVLGEHYFIDGRAFPGNSGGPVFFIDENKNIKIFGIMSQITFTNLGESERKELIPALSIATSVKSIQALTQQLIQQNADYFKDYKK